MTPSVRAARTLAALLVSFAAVAHAETTDGSHRQLDTHAATPAAPFGADDLMLFEVEAGGERLSDSFEGYAARSGVYLPLGALARLLDLAVVVVPPERRAEGWVMERGRTVSLDLDSGRASAGGRSFEVSPSQAVLVDDEIYVRTDLIEQLLPVRAKADLAGLVLTLTPSEPLPFQQRLDRERRRGDLTVQGVGPEAVMRVATPYALFTPPAVELVLDAGYANRAPERTTRYDLRLAGDLVHAGFQLNAGSDDQGDLGYVRVLFERFDADGRATGRPWGVTRASLGDVYSPALSLGARSVGGRGGYFTTAPLEQADVFDGLDLRGELPAGYEVELYVNDVLRASQAAPAAGRYEFLNVPLAFGGNVLRLVFYGPRGERREEVRRINYGRGRVPKGRLYASVGAVQQSVPVVELDGAVIADPGYGRWRLAGGFDYGLSDAVTVSAGFAQYTPAANDTRQVATAGLRTSFDGFALQADLAADSVGGAAVAVGAGGRAGGLSTVVRHAEYAGGFLDETQPRGAQAGGPLLRRSTELRLDALAHVLLTDLALPVSADARRDEAVDGSVFLEANLRMSTAVAGWFFQSSWAWQHVSGASATADRVSGAVDGSELAAAGWRLRGGLAYDIAPEARLSSAFLNADRDMAGGAATTRLGLIQSFGSAPETSLQASQTWRLSAMDVSVAGAYALEAGDYRIGVQLSLGAFPDPWSRRYLPARPGVASGGDLALLAFVDRNRDGVRQADEPAVPDLAIEGGPRPMATDADGRAILTGLGAAPRARLRVPPDGLGDPYLTAPAEVIEFAPRPGRTTRASFPVAALGEAEIQVQLQRPGAPLRGLAAVQVQLVAPDGTVVAAGSTEHDGALILDRLPPGDLAVRIDPDQAQRLGLKLVAPAAVRVPPQGGFAGRVSAIVTLEPQPQPSTVNRSGDAS